MRHTPRDVNPNANRTAGKDSATQLENTNSEMGVRFCRDLAKETLVAAGHPQHEAFTVITPSEAARKHVAVSNGVIAFERNGNPAHVAGVLSHLVAEGKTVTARASSIEDLGHFGSVLKELESRNLMPENRAFKLKVTGNPDGDFWRELKGFMQNCRDNEWPVRVTVGDIALKEDMLTSQAGLRAVQSKASSSGRGFWARLLS
jgi:hypothetical protein